jgi:hypothetical protein
MDKSLDNFWKSKGSKDGLHAYCKPCLNSAKRVYDKKYSKTPRGIEIRRKAIRKYCRKMRQVPEYKAFKNVRNRLMRFLKKRKINKNNSAVASIGLRPDELRQYIESKFKPGMTWDNYGKWHVDHIIPISSAANETEAMKLNHYSNLQPLWASENLKKSNR